MADAEWMKRARNARKHDEEMDQEWARKHKPMEKAMEEARLLRKEQIEKEEAEIQAANAEARRRWYSRLPMPRRVSNMLKTQRQRDARRRKLERLRREAYQETALGGSKSRKRRARLTKKNKKSQKKSSLNKKNKTARQFKRKNSQKSRKTRKTK